MRTETKIIQIKKWLLDLHMTREQIAKECGVSQSLVSLVIYGKRRNQKVIDYFLARGCPRNLLED